MIIGSMNFYTIKEKCLPVKKLQCSPQAVDSIRVKFLNFSCSLKHMASNISTRLQRIRSPQAITSSAWKVPSWTPTLLDTFSLVIRYTHFQYCRNSFTFSTANATQNRWLCHSLFFLKSVFYTHWILNQHGAALLHVGLNSSLV